MVDTRLLSPVQKYVADIWNRRNAFFKYTQTEWAFLSHMYYQHSSLWDTKHSPRTWTQQDEQGDHAGCPSLLLCSSTCIVESKAKHNWINNISWKFEQYLQHPQERGMLVAVSAFKTRQTSGRTGKRVVGLFNPKELFATGWGILGAGAAQSSVHFHVKMLCLAIRLDIRLTVARMSLQKGGGGCLSMPNTWGWVSQYKYLINRACRGCKKLKVRGL